MGRTIIWEWKTDWWISGKCGKSARNDWLLRHLIQSLNLQHWIVSRHTAQSAKTMHQGRHLSTASTKHRNLLRGVWKIKQRKRNSCLTTFAKSMMMSSKVNWILKALFLKRAISRIAKNHTLRKDGCLRMSNMNLNKEWNILKNRKRKSKKRNYRWNSKNTVLTLRSMTIHEGCSTESSTQQQLLSKICQRCTREPVGHPRRIDYTRWRSRLITYSKLRIGINFTHRLMKTQEGSASRSMNRTSPDGTYYMRSICTWKRRRTKRSKIIWGSKNSWFDSNALSSPLSHSQVDNICNRITTPNKKCMRDSSLGSIKDSQVSDYCQLILYRGVRPEWVDAQRRDGAVHFQTLGRKLL